MNNLELVCVKETVNLYKQNKQLILADRSIVNNYN